MNSIQVVGGIKAEIKVEIKCEIQGNGDNIVEIGPNDIVNNESDNEENSVDVDDDNNLVQENQQLKDIKNVKIKIAQEVLKEENLNISNDIEKQVEDKKRNFKVKNNLQLAESLVLNYSVNTDLTSVNNNVTDNYLQEATEEIDVISSSNCSDMYRTQEGTVIQQDHIKIKKNPVPTSYISPTEYTRDDIDKFRCNHCQFVTSSKKYVSYHIRNQHRAVTKTYECPYCPFKSKYYPRYHIISLHKTEKELTWFRCNQCDYKAKLKNALTDHMVSHYDRSEMEVMDRMKKCDKCPKIFKTAKSLSRHKLISHERNNLKPMNCSECEYQTYFGEQLRHHIQVCHSDLESLETLQCPKCPFKTKFRKKFLSHKSKKHRGKVQCEKCGYQADLMGTMQLHMISHKEVKDDSDLKYRCDKCDYKTYRIYSLQIHKLNHLKPEEIQYFYCYHCSFKANRKDNLKTHVLKHFKSNEVTFGCYICNFTTKKRHLLINHIDRHSKGINMDSNSGDSSEEAPIEKRSKRARNSTPTKQLRTRTVRTKLIQPQYADSLETALGNAQNR